MLNKKLHIVIYSELLKYGGGRETWIDYFLPALLERNIFSHIYVYCLYPRTLEESLLLKYSNFDKITFLSVDIGKPEEGHPIKNGVIYTKTVLGLMKKNIDEGDIILLIGTAMESVVGISLKKILKKKIIMIPWVRSITVGEMSTRRSKFYVKLTRFLENTLFKYADVIITNGQDTQQYYTSVYKEYEKKFVVIENAVDYSFFSKIPLPDFKNTPLKICYIGRMVQAKGIKDFIESVKMYSKIDNKDRRIEFHIWGFGEEKNICEPIIFNGVMKRENVLDTLKLCHAVVFLNHSKRLSAGGLSHGLLEAMAAGRLCIAWDNPSHNQILNEENSILLPEGDTKALTDLYVNLARSISNEKVIDSLLKKCKNARKTVSNYSIDNHIDKFIKLLSYYLH